MTEAELEDMVVMLKDACRLKNAEIDRCHAQIDRLQKQYDELLATHEAMMGEGPEDERPLCPHDKVRGMCIDCDNAEYEAVARMPKVRSPEWKDIWVQILEENHELRLELFKANKDEYNQTFRPHDPLAAVPLEDPLKRWYAEKYVAMIQEVAQHVEAAALCPVCCERTNHVPNGVFCRGAV